MNNVIEILIPSDLDPVPIRCGERSEEDWRGTPAAGERQASCRSGISLAGRSLALWERGRRGGLAQWATGRRGEKAAAGEELVAPVAGRRSPAVRGTRASCWPKPPSPDLLTLVVDGRKLNRDSSMD